MKGKSVFQIRRDFAQIQTSVANISGMGQYFEDWKTNLATAIPPAFLKKLLMQRVRGTDPMVNKDEYITIGLFRAN